MFSPEEIADLTRESLSTTDPDDLAYLAVTGKIELPIRDSLGAWMTKKYPELTAAREYKRRDLVLLRDGAPLAVIEGKLWISFEANFPKKLHHPNYKEGLVAASASDIAKMRELSRETGCEMFTSTVLFAADIRDMNRKHFPAIKYPHWHSRGLTSNADLKTTHTMGVHLYRDAMNEFGSCATVRLFEGRVFGMTVLADAVVCKVEN